MKHVVVFLSIVLLAWAPGMVFAQGLFAPGCGMPSCAPAKKAALSPAIYVGYAGTKDAYKGLSVSYDGVVPGTNLRQYWWDIGFSGLQLGAEVPVSVSDKFTGLISGSWFIPMWANGTQHRNLDFLGGLQFRNWGAKPQWYQLNATGLFHMNEATALIGGFLYDNTDVSLNDPDVQLVQGWRPNDNASLKISSYIPYVGLASTMSGFNVGVVAFPYIFGTVKLSYNETFFAFPGLYETSGSFNGGYFLQTWLEFNTTRAGANLGVYAAYSLLHGNVSTSLDATQIFGGAFTGDYDLSVDRQIFMFGAKFSFAFDLPLMTRGLY